MTRQIFQIDDNFSLKKLFNSWKKQKKITLEKLHFLTRKEPRDIPQKVIDWTNESQIGPLLWHSVTKLSLQFWGNPSQQKGKERNSSKFFRMNFLWSKSDFGNLIFHMMTSTVQRAFLTAVKKCYRLNILIVLCDFFFVLFSA